MYPAMSETSTVGAGTSTDMDIEYYHPGSMEIAFRDLTVSVTDRETKSNKAILKDVCGKASPGKLLAIMGQSGAGKSTLLDVLACNKFSGIRVNGTLTVNGQKRDRREFLRNSCYVQQQDILLASATVRECVITSALLKLPASLSRKDKMQRVEDVLHELELEGCSNVLIGDESIGLKGVSGGQKRRVSLAIELVKDPKIIFSDEPTSGLDSEVALSIVDALKQLAKKNRTVVCTIHQPNSDITSMFDDYLLLAGGRVVFGGKWLDAVPFFSAQGYETPMYRNPTDFFVSIVRNPEAANKLADEYALQCKVIFLLPAPSASKVTAIMSPDADVENGLSQTLPSLPKDSPFPLQNKEGFELEKKRSLARTLSGLSQLGVFGNDKGGDGPASVWTQMTVLVTRNTRNWIRSPVMLASELLQYVFISTFVGLMYCKFTDSLTNGIFDRTACIWFAFAVMSFTPSYTAATSWDKERGLLKRELQQQQYGLTSFYLARTAVLLPLTAVQCVIFVSIMYFFCGFQTDAGKFFLFIAVLAMFQIVSEGIGLVCAILTKTATFAIVILTFVLLLILSFSGFLVSNIPPYFVWIGKISYLTYAYAALVQSELTGLYLENEEGTWVEAITELPPQIDGSLSIGINVAILVCLMIAMEIGKLTSLHAAHRFRII